MGKQLKTSVEVEGRWYRPGDRPGQEIPDADVEQIRNPKVWEYTDGSEPREKPAKPVGAQLARRVDVDGIWYGPGDEIPAEVAAQIRNPKAWEGGKVPAAAAAKSTDGDKPPAGQEPPKDTEPPKDADGDKPPVDGGEDQDNDDSSDNAKTAGRGRRRS